MADQQSKLTTDHDAIRDWVEQRGGEPATVRGTERGGEAAGILRIKFPGAGDDEDLETISWEEFFEKFEDASLAFSYQEETQRGGESRYCKLVSRT